MGTSSKNSLTQKVLDYQKTGQGIDALNAEIALLVYDYPRRWTDWDDDAQGEFYLAFITRVPKILQRFVYTGKPFEVYLKSSLRWFLRTFANSRVKRDTRLLFDIQEMTFKAQEAAESFRPENYGVLVRQSRKAPPLPFPLNRRGQIKSEILRKRVLYLILVEGVFLEWEEIKKIAKLTARDPSWLEKQLDQVKILVEERLKKREVLQHRRNECWYRMSTIQFQMNNEPDPQKKFLYEKKINTWKIRWKAAIKALERLSVSPSHGDIARLMGVPKGTVNSSIHYIRKAIDVTNKKPIL